MQRGHITTKPAAVATSCVCMKIHSGKLTSTDSKLILDPFMAWNMNCLILDILGTPVTTYSLKSTTAETHYSTIRLRVQYATWEVVQQSLWFQQERSVRTAGSWSMQDIWSHKSKTMRENAAATFAGTRHLKLQLAQQIKAKPKSTPLKSTVEHCLVHCTSAEES